MPGVLQKVLLEGRRRRVFRTATLYIVGAWVVIQVGDLAFQAWGLEERAVRYLFIGAIIGFPIAVVFGWRYDITREGIVRTAPATPGETVDVSLQRIDYLVLLLLLGAAGVTIWTVAHESLGVTPEADTRAVAVDVAPNSIAVLPFRDLREDGGISYLGDGLGYELTSYLTHLPNLRVTASSSVFALPDRQLDARDVGRLLQVRYVLEGVIRPGTDRLRIDVRLVDTQSGFNVWQDTLDRAAGDPLELQSDVAGRVSASIGAVIDAPGTSLPEIDLDIEPEAYDLYLSGMQVVRNMQSLERPGDWVDRAIGYFERAVEADPDFALAYARLARTHLYFLYTLRADRFEASIAEANRLVQRALVLNPDIDLAYLALAQIYLLEQDPDAQEQALRRALELNPGNADALNGLAGLLWREGRLSEARDFIRAAVARDPLNPNAVRLDADLDAWLGEYASARAGLMRLMEIKPNAPPLGALTDLEAKFGHFDQAARWARQDYDASGGGVFAAIQVLRFAVNLRAMDIAADWMAFVADGPPDLTLPYKAQFAIDEGNAEAAAQMLNAFIERIPAAAREQPLRPREMRFRIGATFINLVARDYDTALQHFARLKTATSLDTEIYERIHLHCAMSWAAEQLERQELAASYLETARSLVAQVEAFGATEFPPVTYARAICRSAEGDNSEALSLLGSAVVQGFRDLRQLQLHPMWQQYQGETEFDRIVATIETDILAQRERAMQNGWLFRPDAGAKDSPAPPD